MSHLFEIAPDFGLALSPEVVALLGEASITAVKFVADGETVRLDWAEYPVVDADTLAKLGEGWKLRRVIANSTTKRLSEFGQRTTTVVNERCHVAVSGLGLLTIDEVENHNDLCTKALQNLLNEGWRIVAVCVQPDQRRPDYILGRTRKEPAR